MKLEFTISCTREIFEKLHIIKSFNIFNSINFQYIELNEILFVFNAFQKEDVLHSPKEYKRLRRKTKTLELYLILDYERIMQGTDPENLLHIKEVFLKGCETFLKPLKDFKWKEFEEQLKQIL